jgi:hypothetical protein
MQAPIAVATQRRSRLPVPTALTALGYFDDNPADPDNDWLLWLDADMDFPADALIRLLRHNVDIVGGDYRLRRRASPSLLVFFILEQNGCGLPGAFSIFACRVGHVVTLGGA